jgi:ketosteroid isomerase-like protein/tetratricopeptide (TPR) repeat protein
VTRASGRCLDVVRVLRITQGAPAVEAVALRCQAVLEALRGRADAARHMIDSSRRMVEELGITQAVLETEMFAGLIALFEGDNAAAERSLRSAYEGLRAHGLGIDAARAAALLGRSLLAQGRAAEAEALSHESESLAGDDLQAAITWRRVRAEALAQRGEDAAAVELARAAVDIAAATDALLHHADARLALAAALRATGRHDDASLEEKRAVELWEAKGATILAERARVGRVRIEPVEITRGPPARHSRRRVRENAATANADRFEAAMAARNADAVATHMADSGEVIDHRTGAVYRRPESLASFLSLFRTPDGSYRAEPLATLGDSLALCRQWSSGSALATKQFDVGSWEAETVLLIEADAQGQRRLTEVFHAETLGDAVARLYERYGELLPEGSARVRAAATGRAVAALAEPPDLGRWAAAIGPAIEATDHRTVGFGSLRGADAVVGAIRALVELGVDNVWRFDDILDLRPDGFVVRWTESGTDRATGGAFERKLCQIFIFGADGLVARWEQFDADSEAAGLARFDELMTQPVPRRARRVRPNTATAYAARLDAAMAARDVDALAKLEAEDIEVVDHPAGTTYGAAANLAARRMLLRAENLKFRHEPLASLGDSLALLRLSISASGVAGGKFDVGAYERDILVLAGGKRSELFAADKLGDAVVRLYERYAELLPDDSERRRIATSARALAAHLGPLSLDRLASSWVGAVEFIDHRIVGFGSVSGVQGFRDVLHTLFELAHDLANRVDDILDLRADAALLRVTNCGTDRAAGGTFERPFLMMWVFRPHGGLQRIEQFDLRQETEALARFDELVGNPPSDLASPISPQPFANAVTRLNERFARAWAARDWDAVAALHAPALRLEDRRRLLQMEGQAETNLAYLRVLFDVPRSAWTMTPIATRGERLALSRYLFEGDAAEGGGALAIDYLGVDEVGSDDRFVNVVLFDPGDLDAAYAELDECYAAGEGAPYAVLLSNLDALGEAAGAGDREAFMGLLPEDFRLVIHRRFADPGAALGRDDFFTLLRTGVGNLDVRFRPRTEHVLRLSPTLGVFVLAVRGTMGGGDFEISLVNVLGHDGSRPRTLETFDPDQLDAALARYEALSRPQLRPVPRRVRPNAATATAARVDAAIAARDVDGFLATWADDCEAIDHPTGVTYGLRELGDTWRRALARAPDLVYRREELATLGEKLALFRQWVHAGAASGGKFDVGEYEIGQLFLNEVDEEGRCRRSERFAVDRLRDAIVRLYERYAETLPEGPEHTRAAATARSIVAFGWDPDAVDGWYRAFAPDVESVDHRILGTWSAQGAEAVVQHLRSLLDLVDDFTVRWDEILALRSDACVVRVTTSGTDRAGGGAYERPYLGLWVFGADGLITRWEQFDIDRGDEAFARFDELTAVSPAARFGNAATRTFARAFDALNLQDWKRFAALFAPGFRSIDRRTMLQSELDRDKWLASYRPIVEMTSPRSTKEVLATRGDRVLLARYRWEGSDKLVGPSEIEYLLLIEVDGRGDHVLVVMFDPDDLDAAYAELDRRFYVGEAAAYPRATELLQRLMKSAATHDWEEFASVFAPDLVFEDHRPLGWGTLRSPGDFVTYVRTLADLAPDVVPRFDHVLELDDQRGMAMMRWVGSRDGGAFEIPVLGVVSFDPEGRIQRLDVYNPDQLDEARARFEQLPG